MSGIVSVIFFLVKKKILAWHPAILGGLILILVTQLQIFHKLIYLKKETFLGQIKILCVNKL